MVFIFASQVGKLPFRQRWGYCGKGRGKWKTFGKYPALNCALVNYKSKPRQQLSLLSLLCADWLFYSQPGT